MSSGLWDAHHEDAEDAEKIKKTLCAPSVVNSPTSEDERLV